MVLLRPPRLRRGSHVRILSPSGPVTEPLLEPGVCLLEDWGLHVSIDERAFQRHRYLAGDDATRRDALQAALDDDEVDAVIFSRGGYGAMRLLDEIDWSGLRRRPRVVCGFSDITALHLAALHHAAVATLHGPVIKSFERQSADLEELRAAMFGERPAPQFEVATVVDGPTVRGRAVGGNLSLVAAMLASRHLPSLDGAVLFLEDVGEEDYRLDRLFTALRMAPAVRNVAAIVLGHFEGCAGVYVSEEELPDFVVALGAELGNELGIPVVANFPFGHGARNVAFGHGVDVEVDPQSGIVTLEEFVE